MPLTLIYPGETIGAMVTGTTLVLRPIPCPEHHQQLSASEKTLPFLVQFGSYTVTAVIMSGQGVNGALLFSKLWYTLTASSGAGMWAYEMYPAPWDNLPQFLAKEGSGDKIAIEIAVKSP